MATGRGGMTSCVDGVVSSCVAAWREQSRVYKGVTLLIALFRFQSLSLLFSVCIYGPPFVNVAQCTGYRCRKKNSKHLTQFPQNYVSFDV